MGSMYKVTEIQFVKCVGRSVVCFNYTYTQCSTNTDSYTYSHSVSAHFRIVMYCCRLCSSKDRGRIRRVFLTEQVKVGGLMLLLSEDEARRGCQSPWQEEKGRGRGQVGDYKIQFRAIEGVDLLYKLPLSSSPHFSVRHKHTLSKRML